VRTATKPPPPPDVQPKAKPADKAGGPVDSRPSAGQWDGNHGWRGSDDKNDSAAHREKDDKGYPPKWYGGKYGAWDGKTHDSNKKWDDKKWDDSSKGDSKKWDDKKWDGKSTDDRQAAAGGASSSGGPAAGPDASAAGPDASAAGPDASAAGPDASAAGPDEWAAGPDASAAGPGEWAAGASADRPGEWAAGPNASAAGPSAWAAGTAPTAGPYMAVPSLVENPRDIFGRFLTEGIIDDVAFHVPCLSNTLEHVCFVLCRAVLCHVALRLPTTSVVSWSATSTGTPTTANARRWRSRDRLRCCVDRTAHSLGGTLT